ncbi:MAG: phosphoribosylglycinamide formyltransferase [Burkholderiales bacterium]|nr:phosphoribosylglycinamide formyltransferase [Burkholderiales bacterium]
MNDIVILVSGRGSNLRAICEAGLAKNIICVISNTADAGGLTIAKEYQIATMVVDHKLYTTRENFDLKLSTIIDSFNPKLIVLAGFMRILTDNFVSRYLGKLINIHPSLLPSFTGRNAQSDAFRAGVKLSGATVHFVTAVLDDGPIIAQGVVPVEINDTEETLAQRILALEHIIYPFIIKKVIDNQVTLGNNNTVIVNKAEQDFLALGKYSQYIYY